MERRAFLAAASTLPLAGCISSGDGSDGEEPGDEDPGTDEPDSPDDSSDETSDDSEPADEADGDADGSIDEDTEPDDEQPDTTLPEPPEDGCPRGFAAARDPWSNHEETEDGDTAVITADLELACGEYAIQQYSPGYAVEFEYEVTGTDNHGLEVIVMERREFDRYREGKSYVYSQTVSDAGKNPSGSGEFPAGEYVFVFDNSDHGESLPEGPIDASVEVRASWA